MRQKAGIYMIMVMIFQWWQRCLSCRKVQGKNINLNYGRRKDQQRGNIIQDENKAKQQISMNYGEKYFMMYGENMII